MTKERELLRRALEDWDFSDKFETLDPIFEDIRTYLSTSDDADEPGNGWQLREVYFEDGEPMMYREPPKPAEPARKPMTSEEMEKQYEIDKEYFGESVMRAFYNGIRFAEKHHGIGGGDE